MSANSNTNIVGTDGVLPIWRPDDGWKPWEINEIYVGAAGAGKFVPKVNDLIYAVALHSIYRVTNVDLSTMLSTWEPWEAIPVGTLTEGDLLQGVGPGTQADTYRVYLNTKVNPHTLSVDRRCGFAGDISHVKIYAGDPANGGRIISAYYDQSNNLIGQDIPVSLAVMPGQINLSWRYVVTGYTTEALDDGTPVVVVAYSPTGGVVSKRQCLIENTGFIPTADVSTRYITGISLKCPFLSSSNSLEIRYPVNVPLQGLYMTGVVHYSDGSSVEWPVDGTKFAMFGFENYVATVVGQTIPLVLRYNLSNDEVVYGATITNTQRFITQQYTAITENADGAYSVKLFGYPVWVDAVNGYTLKWYLYNLNRNVVYDVTGYVRTPVGRPAFQPTAYGVTQNLQVEINLRNVNGIYTNYIHTQTIAILLVGEGTDRGTNWQIQFSPNQNPPYGQTTNATLQVQSASLGILRVSSNCTSLQQWLDKLYFNTKPLINPETELVAPTPNYFRIRVGGAIIEQPVEAWNDDLPTAGSAGLVDNQTIYIEFIIRAGGSSIPDVQLSVAGLPLYFL